MKKRAGSKKTPAPAKAKEKGASKKTLKSAKLAAVVEALSRYGFPTGPGPGLCFTAQDDALFERGYPHLRIVTGEPVPDAEAIARAEEALDAIDPYFRIRVPEGIARRFLLGYRVGPLLFVDQNQPAENAQRREQRALALRSNRAI